MRCMPMLQIVWPLIKHKVKQQLCKVDKLCLHSHAHQARGCKHKAQHSSICICSHAGSNPAWPSALQPRAASPMSEIHALQQKLVSFCAAGRVLSKEESAESEQLAELVKGHLRHIAFRLLRESKHRPVLFAYSSDATPLLTQTGASAASSSGP